MQPNHDTPKAQPFPHVGLRCPGCDYDLTGTPGRRCPECGEAFDPAKLRSPKSGWRSKPSWRVTLTAVLLAIYLPNTWVFWIDYPWNDYRWLWIKITPILPVTLPAAWFFNIMEWQVNLDQLRGFAMLGTVTAGLIAVCYWIGRRSWIFLLITCVAIFVFQVFNAIGCYSLMRM